MSLVSSLSGAIYWNDRASEIERQYDLIAQAVDKVADQAAQVGEAISFMENILTSAQQRIPILSSQLANTQNAGQQAAIQNSLQIAQNQQQQAMNAKMALTIEKNQFDKTERKLQKEMQTIKVHMELAKQTAETSQGMEEGAVKRLAVKM